MTRYSAGQGPTPMRRTTLSELERLLEQISPLTGRQYHLDCQSNGKRVVDSDTGEKVSPLLTVNNLGRWLEAYLAGAEKATAKLQAVSTEVSR